VGLLEAAMMSSYPQQMKRSNANFHKGGGFKDLNQSGKMQDKANMIM